MRQWKEFLRVVARLRFEPHDIAAHLDARGHYPVELNTEFPLLIMLFPYTSRRHRRGAPSRSFPSAATVALPTNGYPVVCPLRVQ